MGDKELDEFINKIRSESFRAGYDKGYEFGLREGLAADKTGVYLCKSGLYVFEDNELKPVKK